MTKDEIFKMKKVRKPHNQNILNEFEDEDTQRCSIMTHIKKSTNQVQTVKG
jgi:hypothetical protein